MTEIDTSSPAYADGYEAGNEDAFAGYGQDERDLTEWCEEWRAGYRAGWEAWQ
jgi:hypothetical protein